MELDTISTMSETKLKKQKKWPDWKTPSNEEEILFARILLPYIKIISPDIVKIIVDDNNRNLSEWSVQFKKLGINPEIYLWKDSPVAFPGIRRHSGTKEISSFGINPKTAKGGNCLLLDDNSFPKEIWSYVLRGTKYNRTNPNNYSLAHIVDHKDYKSRNNYELKGFNKSDEKNLFAGLYTSCVNTIWIPNTLLKPTDHTSNLRKLLIQIVEKYYEKVCVRLPHNLQFNLDNINEEWDINNFPEPTIVGNIDGVMDFIEYRHKKINELIVSANSYS